MNIKKITIVHVGDFLRYPPVISLIENLLKKEINIFEDVVNIIKQYFPQLTQKLEELEQRQEKQKNKKRKSKCNFEQREYPPEFFEGLYENIPSPTSNESEESEMDLDM